MKSLRVFTTVGLGMLGVLVVVFAGVGFSGHASAHAAEQVVEEKVSPERQLYKAFRSTNWIEAVTIAKGKKAIYQDKQYDFKVKIVVNGLYHSLGGEELASGHTQLIKTVREVLKSGTGFVSLEDPRGKVFKVLTL